MAQVPTAIMNLWGVGAVRCYFVSVGMAVQELGVGLLLLPDGPGQGHDANCTFVHVLSLSHDGTKFVELVVRGKGRNICPILPFLYGLMAMGRRAVSARRRAVPS